MRGAGPAALRIERAADLNDLAARVATQCIEVLRSRQDEGAIPCIVLTGGGAGGEVLRALAEHSRRDEVNWTRVRFLWGDERWVPKGHADRNDLLADASLFAVTETDPSLIHRVAGSDEGVSLDDAATMYAQQVAEVLRIDIALNGVGPDGHIASLFPDRSESELTGVGVPEALPIRHSPKPPPERVTLSLDTLNRADHVWLLAAGASKATAAASLISRTEPILPAARAQGQLSTVLWADDDALEAE